MPDLCTIDQAADYGCVDIGAVAKSLAVSRRTVARMCARGEMPAYKVGRQWRIRQTDFVRWMRERKTGKWRQFTSVETPGGFASNGGAKKSDDPLAQLLKARPENISQTFKRNTGA